ncbi:MAG: PSD1 and planctomycete cytochrome C domain-containing protein [Planctomycetia bacterium]|nr:PSD1 and planctomycete cytochrome C domain-containing protein [Planctomycetia bacterium]
MLGCASSASASAAPIDFVRDVRPIFAKHCYACHGAEKQKGNLRLDIKSEAFKGGESYGPSIVAREAKKSPLVQLVTEADAEQRMPPKSARLSDAEIATLTRWIDEGANWPEGVDLAKLEDKREHWSFKPVSKPVPPPTKDGAWPRGEIDCFVLARLEQAGLRPAPEADRAAWLRRVSFDLLGLPPTPEQVETFVGDMRGDAYERMVDTLLKSPRYGERWAQHWLDVVRYADTHGFEVNTERPNAWPYRDYVIEAFNADVPYDRFIREQIAGDALGKDPATGFLVTASVLLPGQIGQDEPSKRLARQDALDEIVVNIGQTFLGLSVGCARCHDHKFDPIAAHDYYAMQAFVAGVEYGDRELRTPEAETRKLEAKQYKQELETILGQLARYVPQAKSGTERPSLGTKATSSGDTTVADRHELRQINDGQYGNSRSWMSNTKGSGWVVLEFPRTHTIERVVWGRDRESKFTDRLATKYKLEVADDAGAWRIVADSQDRKAFDARSDKPAPFSTKGLKSEEAQEAERLVARQKTLEAKLTGAENSRKAFAGVFRTPDVIHLLNRGDPEQPKEAVAPAMLALFGGAKPAANANEQQRRMALADALAAPHQPLTARVMVNRIWQGHFGTGIVETASDFGRTGTKPSHAELLDWLAQEFVRGGWSIKHMHRLIVLSAAYRQSTRHDVAAAKKDADVRLLWRFPSRRLEAEAIRDSMLFVSGRLDLKMGGTGFNLFDKRGGLSGFVPVESFSGEGLRRMIYAHKVRRERDAVFGAFDCPDAGQSTARRRESTTPIQALSLFNSRFTLEQADAFAARVKADAGADVDAAKQIARAYRLALGRDPSAAEVVDAQTVVAGFGLSTLCRALFNSNEFLFLP